MSDTNPGGGAPQDPANPYGTPPQPANPYAAPQQPPNPYGAPPNYGGQQAPSDPYAPGAQPQPSWTGQEPAAGSPGNPYGSQPAYPGQYVPPVSVYGGGSDARPGTVTAAAVITMVMSGLMALIAAFALVALLVAKDEVMEAWDETVNESAASTDVDASSAFGIILAFIVIWLVWCVIACLLGIGVLRRSNVSRVVLVISAAVAALLSLLAITSVVSAVTLIGAVATIVCLFTGGANQWFANKNSSPQGQIPGMTTY